MPVKNKKKPPIGKRALDRFNSTFKDPWHARIQSSPQLEAMLIQLCKIELELEDLQERLDRMDAAGEDSHIVEHPNGEISSHPLRKELKDLRSAQRAYVKQLGMSYDRKDPERTRRSAIAERMSGSSQG